MNRRDALKGVSLSIGNVLAAPTIFSLLQSCKTEEANWIPKFLSVNEGEVIKKLTDLILPNTEATPGALDVNVAEFIDLMADKVLDIEKQTIFKERIGAIMKELGFPDKEVNSLKTHDYDNLLTKYLRATKKEKETFEENKHDALVLAALNDLRAKAIWGYTTSEQVGEHVLAYDPIPGVQLGCISVEEATGGKRWSL